MPYRLYFFYRCGTVDFWYSEQFGQPEGSLCLGLVEPTYKSRHALVRANRTRFTRDPIQFLLSRLHARHPNLALVRHPDGRYDYTPLLPPGQNH